MKRTVILFIPLILCFNLFACGYKNTSETGIGERASVYTTDALDPNGFKSMEEIVDVYFRVYSGGVVTKGDIQKMYPQEVWDNWESYRESSLDDTYSGYLNNCASLQDKYTRKYGEDYVTSYSIRGMEEERLEASFSQEEIEYCLKLYGAHPRDCAIYHVSLDISIKGSAREDTLTDYTIIVRKIGDKWYGY